MHRTPILLVAATLAGGCGGGKADAPPAVREGAVIYRDALRDNRGGWFVEKGQMSFQGDRYLWRDIPTGVSPSAGPDALLERQIPTGLSVSVGVEVDKGAALRVIDCRELGPRDKPVQDWYELGIDGRQALIRRMAADAPPRVLARRALDTPSGKRVRLTGQCVPDAHGRLVLVLEVDGRQVARASDAEPLPAARDGIDGTLGIRAYARPDSPGPASIAWQDFEVRTATVP
jgi:hypothetical protein